MHRSWKTVVTPLIEALRPGMVVEVGAADGRTTRGLLGHEALSRAEIHTIDVEPEFDESIVPGTFRGAFTLHRGRSLNHLPLIQAPDLVLIDGDHNWYTVMNELRLLDRGATAGGWPFPFVALHDIGWPYGRRDMYYEPDAVPGEHRQPFDTRALHPDSRELVDHGINAHLANSIYEHGLRNGVLTAVEDFIAESERDLRFLEIPGLHGLGLLAEAQLLKDRPEVRKLWKAFGDSRPLRRHLGAVERQRLEADAALARSRHGEQQQAKRLESVQEELAAGHRRIASVESELADLRTAKAGLEREQELHIELHRSVEAQARAHAREALAAVERVNQARAWRWGHRLSLLARRLTFRPSVRSRSGLDVAAEQLEGLVATVSESQEAPIPTGREERYVDLAATVREREATRRAESLKLLASGAQRRGVLRADSVAGKPSVDVIVCVHNAVEYVERCLRSLLGTTTHPFRLVIVDDGSDGETARLLRAVAGGADAIELVERRHPPHGYTRAANAGLGASTADYAVLLNSDTEVTAEWLRTLVETAESDPSLGIVGPLGNAATYQSVPEISRDGKWWNNPMPDWLTPEGVGLAVRTTEGPPAPLAGVLNGFCLCIKRSVIDRIGTFDEEHFGDGYGEENDYCLRATEAGFRLAIATRSFVFHAKSRSYGEDRDDLSKLGGEALRAKHRPSSIEAALASVRDSADLAELRQVTAAALRDPRRLARRLREAGSAPESVAFVLPGLAAGGSGGSHSIVQEARGMANLGIAASIAIPAAAQDRARFAYAEHDDLFVTYDKPADLPHVLDGVQAVIATHHKSVDAVLEVAHASNAVVAYYVQDYEPWFFAPGSAEAREVAASYERMADHVLLAKTYWLGALLASEHGVRVEKVEPSIDSTLFRPAPRPPRGAHARVAAMIRPGTPRRQPSQTLDLLKRLDEEMGGIEAVTFGCEEAELRALTQNERVLAGHRGVLRRREVAEVLRSCDLFVDMSSYQAFGRTAVEAMASGTLAAGPLRGGFAEVAPGDAALHLDTADLEASAIAIADLLGDLQRAEEMRQRGEAVAGLLSVERAALSELVALGKAGAERMAAGAQR